MSRTMKIVLGVVGVVLLLGCLGVLGVGFLGARFFGQAANPEQARAVAAQIADYDLPEGYREAMGIDLMGMKMAMIAPEGITTSGASGGLPAGLMIMLAQMPPGGGDAAAMQAQMQSAMGQQGGFGGGQMQPAGTVDITIRGQPVTLQRSEGSAKNGQPVKMLAGAFEGKSGPAMVTVYASADGWDEAQAMAFLRSMR